MFTYQQLLEDLDYLRFLGLETGFIGNTEAGFGIPFVHYGKKAGKQIIITGGIHARENVSASMVIRQAYFLARTGVELWGGIYFVPMINVDGALLIEKGADFFESLDNFAANNDANNVNSLLSENGFANRSEFLVKTNGGSHDFSLWKANINAVDLNTNFDAQFGCGVSNKTVPAPSDYIGCAPFDQSETRALRDFTLKIMPAATVSYHALGRELYWFFGQTANKARDNAIATRLNDILGYKKIDDTLGSAGGYKDWCIQKLGIPSFTIEIGRPELAHPLSEEDVEEDWIFNRQLPQVLLGSL